MSNEVSPEAGRLDQPSDDWIEFDLKSLLGALRRRLRLILGVFLSLTVIAVIVIFQITPRYTATSTVLIDTRTTQVVDMDAVLSGLSADTAVVDSQVELIKSRTLAGRVVRQLKLARVSEFNATLRAPSLLSYVDPRPWIRDFLKPTAEFSAEEEEERIHNRVVDNFLSNLSVSRKGLTYIIRISYTSEDPRLAQKIANVIADLYIVEQLEAKYEATRKANLWLSERLATLRSRLRDSERAVEIFRSQNNLVGSGGLTVNEQQLSELNAQLILARTDRAERQARYDRSQTIIRQGGKLDEIGDVLKSNVIADLRRQEAEIGRKLSDLLSRYGDKFPAVQDARNERNGLRQQIREQANRIVAGLKNDVEVANTRVNSLEKSLTDSQESAGVNNQAQIQLRELEREAEANKALYGNFLGRFKETEEQEQLQASDARIISAATMPSAASYPKKSLSLFLIMFVNGAIGIGLGFLMDRLDNTVHNARELESDLGLPVLASVPLLDEEDGLTPQDYLLQKPLSAFTESLRAVRSSLELSNVDRAPQVIVFTSALPNEGKTTTSISFARAASVAGKKVLLIDCDLRRPSVHKMLLAPGDKPSAGLVEHLAGKASFDEVVCQDAQTNLSFVPVVSSSINPTEVLGSAQMERMLAHARTEYDLVVIDCAPVLAVTDPRVIAQRGDEILFIVRWNSTPKDAVIDAVKALHQHNLSVTGAVLTQVDMAQMSKYSYGKGGYYYGQYQSYYLN
ncbi:MAG: polysaccharide biosynthesis tyrosine autokinase [Parvibaculaceae bacterium]|nr:polysaccharide biosynthesis tyrosine autokinase [Parvibaculaceae bacterium]